MLSGKTVLLGISGGIAAYKAVEVASGLRKLHAEVHVIMTENASKFVSPLTFRTISAEPVTIEMFGEPKRHNVEHIALAEKADLFLICPATANVIGKIASGIADDFLTTTVLACDRQKVVCPAMNHRMYASPQVQENLEKLRRWGYIVVPPEYGMLASGAMGQGRLPEPATVISVAKRLLAKKDMSGLKVLVTAGPTREFLDPVRYISPPSSGKMGFAIAGASSLRGAEVVLVAGPTDLKAPEGVLLQRVVSTRQMLDACVKVYPSTDIVIGAAAPSDYRPKATSDKKIKKSASEFSLTMVPTEDILGTLGKDKGGRVLVGFAAETDNLIEYALGKIKSKNLDLISANQVGLDDRGFGSDRNAVTLVYPNGATFEIPLDTKDRVADLILDKVMQIVSSRKRPVR